MAESQAPACAICACACAIWACESHWTLCSMRAEVHARASVLCGPCMHAYMYAGNIWLGHSPKKWARCVGMCTLCGGCDVYVHVCCGILTNAVAARRVAVGLHELCVNAGRGAVACTRAHGAEGVAGGPALRHMAARACCTAWHGLHAEWELKCCMHCTVAIWARRGSHHISGAHTGMHTDGWCAHAACTAVASGWLGHC